MITKELLAKELRKPGLSRRDASVYVDVIFETITDMLKNGENIQLRGFGTFYVKKRASHKANLNGQITIPEHSKIGFRPCDSLRKAVWNCEKPSKGEKNGA